MPSSEFISAVEYLFNWVAHGDWTKIGAVKGFQSAFMGIEGIYFHGRPCPDVYESMCKDEMAAVNVILNEPITIESAKIFASRIGCSSYPSKAWIVGAPMRRMIKYSRACDAILRIRDKELTEARIKAAEEKRHSEILAFRAKRSQRMVKNTTRALMAATESMNGH